MLYDVSFVPSALAEYKILFDSDMKKFLRVTELLFQIIFTGHPLKTSLFMLGYRGPAYVELLGSGEDCLLYKVNYPISLWVDSVLYPFSELKEWPVKDSQSFVYSFPDGRKQVFTEDWFITHYKAAGSLPAMAKLEGIPLSILERYKLNLGVNLNNIRKRIPELNEETLRSAWSKYHSVHDISRHFMVSMATVADLLRKYNINFHSKDEE